MRRIEDAALAGLMCALLLVTVLAVASRYAFSQPFAWAEEVVMGLFVWIVFLGSARAWADKRHIGIDVFVERLDPRLRVGVSAATFVVIVLTLIALGFLGVRLAIADADTFTTNLGVPRLYVEMALPIGAALMLWHSLEHILEGRYAAPVVPLSPL